ncbi:hypothetical protein CTheo_8684 [Ceratobasidium theobromae]|uniref:Uncharacterized protein n=1 Tax=Ceratobasidium theobromae TaxID=1582974 RepID=A0A5N5Q871_9AGAM|nr:hypothetical protein CTheo_8684 [Ceratobasidium theobromae]
MQAANLHFKEEALKEAITLKMAEITFLQQGLDITMWHKMLDDLVSNAYEQGPSKALIPVWTMPANIPEGMQVEASISYVVDLTAKALFLQTRKELSYFGHAVLCLAQAKTATLKEIATKKEGLKQKANPKLANPTPVASLSGLSRKEIDDVIAKSVAKVLKDMGHQAPKMSQHRPCAPSKNLGRGPPPKRDAAKATTMLAVAGSSGGMKSLGSKHKASGPDTSKAQKKKPKKN